MPIRSKRLVLLATVFAPAISLSINIQPSIAQPAETSVILAQDSSEEFPQDQNLEQQQAEEEARRAAEEQQRAAEEENRRQAEEQQRAAQEEADRQADEQRRIAEQAQREAIEQQRANEEELKNQAEQARQKAESEQRAAEEQMRQRAEEEKRIAHEEAERQARAQEKAAEEAKRNAAEHQAGEEQQRAVEEQARQKAAEESAKQEIENPPSAPVEETKSEAPAAQPSKNEGEEEQPTPPIVQEAPQPQPEAPVEQPTEQPRVDHSPAEPTPQPEIVDQLTTEEKQEIAKDPAKSDETVVLPVENGAAVLDSDKDADNRGGNLSREDRRKQREQQRVTEENTSPPADDAAAQVAMPDAIKDNLSQKIEANLKEEGKRIKDAPAFAVPETTNIINNTVINNTVINNTAVNNIDNSMTNVKVIEQIDNRVILDVGDRIFVRGDDRPRLRRDAERSYYDELPGGRMRETIVRPGGYEIVTVYNRYGDILQRTRIDRDGNEYLMMYAPEYDDGPRAAIIDVGYELPPMRLTVPVRDYIIDVADDPDRDFYDFLARPPVERVERVYTIDEVRHSARLRDKVRRIDLDTIHFATGSAEVSLSQAKTLRKVADAMHKVLQKDPGETFLIEGHTDAVGSDRSNLILSDRRAESVASLLTEVYDIPAENLVTQGYGERFLKIRTQAAEQENRRVTIRRVTPLVRPVAQR